MKIEIKIERVDNGFIISNENINVKKIAQKSYDVGNIIAMDLCNCFDGIKLGHVKTITFEIQDNNDNEEV